MPKILLRAIVSLPHITVTSSSYLGAWILLLHVARHGVLLVKQDAFVGAAIQLIAYAPAQINSSAEFGPGHSQQFETSGEGDSPLSCILVSLNTRLHPTIQPGRLQASTSSVRREVRGKALRPLLALTCAAAAVTKTGTKTSASLMAGLTVILKNFYREQENF